MHIIALILLIILFILRLKYLIQLFFSVRFWLGMIGQALFFVGASVALGVSSYFFSDNEPRHYFVIFFVILTWIFFNFMFYNFRAPVIFLFGLITLGLIAAAASGGDGGGGDGGFDYAGDMNLDFPPNDINAFGFGELAMGSELSTLDSSVFTNFQTEIPNTVPFEPINIDTYMQDFNTIDQPINEKEFFNAGAYLNYLDNTNMDVSMNFDVNENGTLDSIDNDLNNNNVHDHLDRDMDNDGTLDFIDNDMDNDKIPDYDDNDMDNDGIPDVNDSVYDPKK